jgi:hypothetical protein
MNDWHKIQKNDDERRNIIVLYCICIVLTVGIFFIDLSIPLGVAGGVPYLMVILLTLWLPLYKNTILPAFICSFLTIMGFYFSPPGGEMWKVLTNRSLALFAIWTTAFVVIQKKSMDIEQEKHMSEIKILQGLLPICASCKKIRDGSGKWNEIEVYIKDRSEADFSHGICPDCLKKLYPEIASKQNNQAQS